MTPGPTGAPVADSLSSEHLARWVDYCFYVRGRSRDEVTQIVYTSESQNPDAWCDAWNLIGEWLDWQFGVEAVESEGDEPE